MIEKTLLSYLNEKLDVPCYMEYPQNKPDEYVVLEKTGSGINNYIRSATFAVQSISTTLYKAAELNEKVKEAMDYAFTLPSISKSELTTDYNYTDTSTKAYRYQAVYDIYYYE